LNSLAAIFLTLLIFLSAGISPAFAKVVFSEEIGGLLYKANTANQTKTYHFDQVGSTIARTDDAGKVNGRMAYSAYGLTTFTEGDMATPFRHNGQAGVITEKNGLLHMRARYYSPDLMRFLNADPIGFSGGSNWYSYADGNPISMSDPFGLCAESGGSWGSAQRTAAYTFNSLPSPVQDFMESASNELGRMWNDIAGGVLGTNPELLFAGMGNALKGA
jgi:RHS repeat-associated protein